MRVTKIIVILITLIAPCAAFSEYDGYELMSAAGGYLALTDIVEKSQGSECSYLFRDKKYSLRTAIENVKSTLRENDQKKLEAFLNGKKWKKDLQQNSDMLPGFMAAGKKDGLDTKTLCGMWLQNISGLYKDMSDKWSYSSRMYSR